ncbi:hypothetical protein HN604_03890 [archaeon]|jgi:hypothetical protein|nr:hypothetical protein [archaeon]MBT6182298.1 hypothetical protein [archaeon]MBT6606281.1 hypothetical protein [archaeon]MBT7251550.1 hypothetical protein [archaeon]MBT7661191.1 hypothetical protein [archaeon]
MGNKSSRDFISEIIIIVAGFILAETFVKKVLEVSAGAVPWWVFTLLAIMFLVLAFEIRNEEKRSWFYYFHYILYPLLITYIVLMRKEIIGNNYYIWLTLGTVGTYNLLGLISWICRKKKIRGKPPKKRRKK